MYPPNCNEQTHPITSGADSILSEATSDGKLASWRRNPAERLAVMKQTARNFPGNRKGPFRQLQRRIATEVDFILGHVVREGERQGIATPLCRKLVRMIHEIETGRREFHVVNYAHLTF